MNTTTRLIGFIALLVVSVVGGVALTQRSSKNPVENQSSNVPPSNDASNGTAAVASPAVRVGGDTLFFDRAGIQVTKPAGWSAEVLTYMKERQTAVIRRDDAPPDDSYEQAITIESGASDWDAFPVAEKYGLMVQRLGQPTEERVVGSLRGGIYESKDGTLESLVFSLPLVNETFRLHTFRKNGPVTEKQREVFNALLQSLKVTETRTAWKQVNVQTMTIAIPESWVTTEQDEAFVIASGREALALSDNQLRDIVGRYSGKEHAQLSITKTHYGVTGDVPTPFPANTPAIDQRGTLGSGYPARYIEGIGEFYTFVESVQGVFQIHGFADNGAMLRARAAQESLRIQ